MMMISRSGVRTGGAQPFPWPAPRVQTAIFLLPPFRIPLPCSCGCDDPKDPCCLAARASAFALPLSSQHCPRFLPPPFSLPAGRRAPSGPGACACLLAWSLFLTPRFSAWWLCGLALGLFSGKGRARARPGCCGGCERALWSASCKIDAIHILTRGGRKGSRAWAAQAT